MAHTKMNSSYATAIACGIALSGAISYPLSGEFAVTTFMQDIVRSVAYLLASAIAVLCYRTARGPTSWWLAFLVGGIMMVTASTVYSALRQYTVLLVLPSLFCLPGVVLGKLLVELLQSARMARDSASNQKTDG